VDAITLVVVLNMIIVMIVALVIPLIVIGVMNSTIAWLKK
jgi:hypothetical protein